MMDEMRKRLLYNLDSLWALAPEMRFGQLMATLGFLTEDKSDHTIWDIEDEEMLRILANHRAELENRQSSAAKSIATHDR